MTSLKCFITLQTQMVFLSGKTGLQFGSTVVLNSMETANHLLHHSTGGSHYVLLQKGRHPKQKVVIKVK